MTLELELEIESSYAITPSAPIDAAGLTTICLVTSASRKQGNQGARTIV
jgi:hypothetical protein